MKRERRQPSRAEWRRITSGAAGPVVRRIPKPEPDEEKLDRIAGESLGAHLEDEVMCGRREEPGR